jgi:hypothetical protein
MQNEQSPLIIEKKRKVEINSWAADDDVDLHILPNPTQTPSER